MGVGEGASDCELLLLAYCVGTAVIAEQLPNTTLFPAVSGEQGNAGPEASRNRVLLKQKLSDL